MLCLRDASVTFLDKWSSEFKLDIENKAQCSKGQANSKWMVGSLELTSLSKEHLGPLKNILD